LLNSIRARVRKRMILMNSIGMQEEEIMRHLIRDVRGLHTKDKLSYNGDTRFAKEQYFVEYVFSDTKRNVTSPLKDKWIGFKFVV
jgi:hypothetical protein